MIWLPQQAWNMKDAVETVKALKPRKLSNTEDTWQIYKEMEPKKIEERGKKQTWKREKIRKNSFPSKVIKKRELTIKG